jgi:hypothetical protein
VIEDARATGALADIAAYRNVEPTILLGLAAREFAGKLDTIEHRNVTPELHSGLMRELGRAV